MFPSSTTVNGCFLHTGAVQYDLFDHESPCYYRNDHLSSPPFFHFSSTIDMEEDDHHGDHAFDQLNLFDGHFPNQQYPLMMAANASSTTSTTPAAKADHEAIGNSTSTDDQQPKIFNRSATDICSLMGPDAQSSFFPRKKMIMSSNLGRKLRGSKKDRHSKIFTRQGPRDRRMRLSLEIARKFFDLQDMLGFDKASKTVDWLMTMAREEIKQLSRDHYRAAQRGGGSGATTRSAVSSPSEGEVVSGFDECHGIINPGKGKKKAKEATPKVKSGRTLPSRKAAFNPLSKEGRARAREWARERTKTKKIMMNRKVDESNQLPDSKKYGYDPNQLTMTSTHIEIGHDQEPGSKTSHKKTASSELGHHQSSLHDTVSDSLSIFQYHPQQISTISNAMNSDHRISLQNNDMNNFLTESWDMDSARSNPAAGGYAISTNAAPLLAANLQERIGSALFKMPMGNCFHPQLNNDTQFYAKLWENYDC